MVPLVFILIVSLILILLVYWVLSTMRLDETKDEDAGTFFFESAPELFTYGYMPAVLPYIPFEPDRLKLIRGNANHLIAYWMVGAGQQAEFTKNGSMDGKLVLRIYQTSFGIIFDDVWVDTLKGSHYFESKPETAYYAVLGVKKDDTFFPWLYSNTLLTSTYLPGSKN
ncbi:MAG TPA: hypothetical protein DER33_09175 [Syntrophomonas sp.]|jgi:uncharacterized membrane protein YwzB|nr:hypothetical protein [Syntrophomonas sp.]HCF71734.1 hypothetical protein [Syntrophomonas sp.]